MRLRSWWFIDLCVRVYVCIGELLQLGYSQNEILLGGLGHVVLLPIIIIYMSI
jgi:hypothetical protein